MTDLDPPVNIYADGTYGLMVKTSSGAHRKVTPREHAIMVAAIHPSMTSMQQAGAEAMLAVTLKYGPLTLTMDDIAEADPVRYLLDVERAAMAGPTPGAITIKAVPR